MAWLPCLVLIMELSIVHGSGNCSADGTAVLQLHMAATSIREFPGWQVAALGQTCDEVCGVGLCNKPYMAAMRNKFFMDRVNIYRLGRTCGGYVTTNEDYPLIHPDNNFYCGGISQQYIDDPSLIRCDKSRSYFRSVCYCDGTTTTTTLPPNQWHLAPFGEPCKNVCGANLCDTSTMATLTTQAAMTQVLSDNFGLTCQQNGGVYNTEGAPKFDLVKNWCTTIGTSAVVNCETFAAWGNLVCYCSPGPTTVTTTLLPNTPRWQFAGLGQTCDSLCGPGQCNKELMTPMQSQYYMERVLYHRLGQSCGGYVFHSALQDGFAAVHPNNNYYCLGLPPQYLAMPDTIHCDKARSIFRNICVCDGTTTTTTLASDQWHLAPFGEPCKNVCGANLCDTATMASLTSQAAVSQVLSDNFGLTCQAYTDVSDGAATWDPVSSECGVLDGSAEVNCDTFSPWGNSLCFCRSPTTSTTSTFSSGDGSDVTTTSTGMIDGDPHVHSLLGAHHTLLKRGNFMAWNFSKARDPDAEVQLVASYGGAKAKFTPQALLLKSKKRSMEITAQDCIWRSKKPSGWSPAKPGLRKDGKLPILQFQGAETGVGELYMKTGILIHTKDDRKDHHGLRKVARLFTACRPNDHLNFIVTMFESRDLKHVGGELGMAPSSEKAEYFNFLSLKSKMKMETDEEFQVASWKILGGSDAAAEFLKSKEPLELESQSFLSMCSEVEEQDAQKLCTKHLQHSRLLPEILSDCVFDVCHGGGESAAESLAALVSE